MSLGGKGEFKHFAKWHMDCASQQSHSSIQAHTHALSDPLGEIQGVLPKDIFTFTI